MSVEAVFDGSIIFGPCRDANAGFREIASNAADADVFRRQKPSPTPCELV